MLILLLLGLFVLNIPIFLLLGKAFFGDWGGFVASLVAMITPDITAALSGDYENRRIGRFTFITYVLVCLVTWAAEYHVVAKFLFGVAAPWSF